MKVYVQNGHNKKVLNAGNYKQASIKFLGGLVTKKADGSELAELSPITFASNCGFHGDILKMGMDKAYDDVKMFRTAKVFDVMGRKDIGKWMRKHEKTVLSGDARKLVMSL
jgi:hypothetical protein